MLKYFAEIKKLEDKIRFQALDRQIRFQALDRQI